MINVGIIGFGYAAKTFHLPLIEFCAEFNLVAISSSQRSLQLDKHPHLKIFPTAQLLIDSNAVDLVIITSPNDTHFSLAKAALESGLHVVIEKPMANTAEQARALCAIAKSHNRVLTVFHNRRWDGDYLTIQKLLADRSLGELKVFESHFDRFRPIVRDRWRENPGIGSGIWYDLGPHLVDQALHLFGAPLSVTGQLKMLRDNSLNIDYFHVQLHYSSFEVILHSSPYNAGPNPRFQLSGTKGCFIKRGLDPQEEQLKAGIQPSSINYGVENTEQHGKIYTENSAATVKTLAGQYQSFYQQLATCIEHRGPPPVNPASAALVIQIIELAVSANNAKQTLAFNAQ